MKINDQERKYIFCQILQHVFILQEIQMYESHHTVIEWALNDCTLINNYDVTHDIWSKNTHLTNLTFAY